MTAAPIALEGEQIPTFLRNQDRWLTWRLAGNAAGKLTKKPDRSTRDPNAASKFEAVATVARSSEGGIGFITTGKIPVPLTDGRTARLLIFDLDACRDPQSGHLTAWASWCIEQLGKPYTEVSPSGTGLRAVVAVIDLPEHLKATVKISEEPRA